MQIAIAELELLEANEKLAKRRFEIGANAIERQRIVTFLAGDMQPHVHHASHDLLDLDVHAMLVEMTTYGVERLLRLKSPIDRNQVVRHQQHADGGVGDEPVDQRVARQTVQRLDQMRQSGPVHGVDAFEHRGDRLADGSVRMRLQLGHRAIDLGENVACRALSGFGMSHQSPVRRPHQCDGLEWRPTNPLALVPPWPAPEPAE